MASKNDKRGFLATTTAVEQFEDVDRLPWPIGAACNMRGQIASHWVAIGSTLSSQSDEAEVIV